MTGGVSVTASPDAGLEERAREVLAESLRIYPEVLLSPMRDELMVDADGILAAMLTFARTLADEARWSERERCARVAESCQINVPLSPGCPDGASLAARTIATAIRESAQ